MGRVQPSLKCVCFAVILPCYILAVSLRLSGSLSCWQLHTLQGRYKSPGNTEYFSDIMQSKRFFTAFETRATALKLVVPLRV